MASKRKWIIIAAVVLLLIIVLVLRRPSGDPGQMTMRTAKAEMGKVVSSVSGNGTLEPLTTVEVKSNVGGQVIKLAVDEGDVVRAGQIIAKIDPSDAMTNLQQAEADYAGALARVQQTREGETLQGVQTSTGVRAAEEAVESARQRLAQAEKQAQIQPQLTNAAIKQAESSLASAQASLKQTKSALAPQKIASAKASYDQAKATYDQAQSNLERQKALHKQGFVPSSQVESAEQQFGVAKAQLDSAQEKLATVKGESDEDINTAQARVDQAKAALETARVNQSQDTIKKQEVAAMRASLRQAEASLASAKSGVYQESMKHQDIIQAQAQLERAKAAVKNARIQVNYTTIISPRAGVVVKKYVEEGSIVTAGRASFSGTGEGITIVEVADTNRMQVTVNVDETDIAQIRVGQRVDINIDAYPDEKFFGSVTKIAPMAQVEQNVTTIPVTVEIVHPDRRMKPGMNATCDFVVAQRSNVLVVPSEAVKESPRGSYVNVMEQGKPVRRPVKIGITGDDTTEILSGLRAGETVVTAEIKLEPNGASGPPRGMRGGPRPF